MVLIGRGLELSHAYFDCLSMNFISPSGIVLDDRCSEPNTKSFCLVPGFACVAFSGSPLRTNTERPTYVCGLQSCQFVSVGFHKLCQLVQKFSPLCTRTFQTPSCFERLPHQLSVVHISSRKGHLLSSQHRQQCRHLLRTQEQQMRISCPWLVYGPYLTAMKWRNDIPGLSTLL